MAVRTCLKAAAARDPASHRYPETEGLPEFRRAVADWYERRFGLSLDPEREVVVYCRSGARSQAAGRRIRAAGFPRVLTLAGGILRYGADVDPSIPRY